MGLAQVQHALARLYSDPSLREQFFRDPAATGAAFGLTTRESESLAELSVSRVDFFARSLYHKRLNEVAQSLPLTRQVLGKQFAILFEQYAGGIRSPRMKNHHEEAIAFADFLGRLTSEELRESLWAGELARCEAAWVKASDPTRRWIACWFRHSTPKLAHRVSQSGGVLSPPRQPTLALWIRLWRRRPLRHFVFSIPRPLVNLVIKLKPSHDGARKQEEIIRG